MRHVTIFITCFALSIIGLSTVTESQECGPNCPVCSGQGEHPGDLLEPQTIFTSILYLPDFDDETAVLNTRYGITSWFDGGIGYAFDQEEIIWSARIQPFTEDKEHWRPGLILGTGSVQTGGSDQSVFAMLTKKLNISDALTVCLSGGFSTLLPDLDKGYGLAGVTLQITDRFSPFANYDGRNFHLGLAWMPTEWLTIAGLLVEEETPALSGGLSWKLKAGQDEKR